MQVASVPRTLVIAAHPDMTRRSGRGVLISCTDGVQVVHASEGSPRNPSDAWAAGFSSREEYAAARRREMVRALAVTGLPESAISNLHFTDQQLALLAGRVFPFAEHQRYFAERIVPELDSERRYIGEVAMKRKRRLLSSARCLIVPSVVPETSRWSLAKPWRAALQS